MDCWFPECGWDANVETGAFDCSCDALNTEFAEDFEDGFVFASDCQGACYYTFYLSNWAGDGHCDDGAWGIDLNCADHAFDGGDCTVD